MIAPKALAQDYDNPGLLIGHPDVEVDTIAFALEGSARSVKTAINKGANLLVTHHPFIFKPIYNVDQSTPAGGVIELAIKSNLAIYAAHTNFDAVKGGMNDILVKKLGFDPAVPFIPEKPGTIFKLVTFVPESHLEKVSGALFSINAGVIGKYKGCSFRSKGYGTFIPQDGADPFSGKVGKPSLEKEIRMETLVSKDILGRAIKELLNAHPYDEPAFDVYPLKNMEYEKSGLGRFTSLRKTTTLVSLANQIKEKLKIKSVRIVGARRTRISNVVVCSGSGSFLVPLINKPHRTCLVTGDIKYHDAQLALDRGLSIIDAGHFATEIIFAKAMRDIFKKAVAKRYGGKAIKTIVVSNERDPINTI